MLALAALALAVPLHFEPNRGQADAHFRYLSTNGSLTVLLSDTDVTLRTAGESLRMNIPQSSMTAEDKLPGISNYYFGPAPSGWRTHVPQYGRIRYRDVFPGVDLVLYGNQGGLEYDWVVAPGAKPARIHYSFSGAGRITVDAGGDLVIRIGQSPIEVRHRRPLIYQDDHGVRRAVSGGFVTDARGMVRFHVRAYDRSLPLIIDPILLWSTGFGGTGYFVMGPMPPTGYSDTAMGIVLDQEGYIYVCGIGYSGDFPFVHPLNAVPPPVHNSIPPGRSPPS